MKPIQVVICAAILIVATVGCGEDEPGGEGTAGSGGTAGTSGTAGTGGSGGGVAGSGGQGGSGGHGGGSVEPPIVCTDQCHYVRPGATGADTGESWSDAFPAIPDDLSRGHVYLLADGDYGGYTLDDPASGTDEIWLRKATIADHGTDEGWLDEYGDGVALFSNVTFDGSYFVLDGTKGGGPTGWDSGHGIEIERTGTVCTDNGSLLTFAAGASHVSVRHVHAHAASNDYPMDGVKGTGGASELTLAYTSIHTTFGPTFHIGDWTDAVIEQSYLADVRSTGAGDPYCEHWHAEGISSIGTNQNITIRHNIWDRIGGTAVFAGVNTGQSIGWKIYGNTFARSVTTLYYYYDASTTNQQTMDDLEFYNNNVVHMPGSSVGTIVIQSGSNNVVQNNIWYDNIANTFVMSGVTHDYNLFAENRRIEGCSPVCEKDDEGATGEAHGQVGSGSPFAADDPDPRIADLHLAAPTDPGVTLNAPFDTDAEGRTRGADGTWDRGMYELD
ncbi:MAG: hypothetical protein JRI23_29185 [Deltaproteobacteria bacterium]|nr:hypothetical protein [Deltaproteobacteria bacterium]MBW2536213.1 hypothetical protein [Deltaproteobacteria bacterium]